MSDNPLIEGFLNLHEAGGVGGGMSGTKFSNAANYAPAVGAGVRGAFNNATMDKGKYARAAVDYIAKNSGSLAGVSEPTTFDKELEQENEKDIAAQRDYPVAYDIGDKVSTAAQVVSGVGAAKALGTAVLKAGIKATTKNTAKTVAKNFDASDFELGVKNVLDLTPEMRVAKQSYPNLNKPPFNQTLQAKPYSAPKPTLNPTPQTKTYPKFTREENDSSEGNTEMSTNPYIKGFFDIEEARAKNTNIFDESKKLTAAQKKNLDKNDNDKIDAEDFKMLRKEEADLDENAFNQLGQKKPVGDILPAPAKGSVPIHGKKFKEGDIVVPHAGPHAGVKHKVVVAREGSVNMIPLGISAKEDKYNSATVRAKHEHLSPYTKSVAEEADLDEAKKTNSMVMARNISKALKAVKPDFLDIDKDGDKEESMKKAAADKKKESDLDEAVSDEHRERALATINARISKPGQPPKHPTYDGAPADIKTAVDNLAKMYAESVDLDEVNILPSNFSDRTTPVPNKKAYAIDKANSEKKKPVSLKKAPFDMKKEEVDLDEGIKEKIGGMIRREKEKEYPLLQNRRDVAAGKAAKSYAAGDEKKGDRYMKFRSDNMKKEEVGFSEEEIDFINNVMEAMPVAPTSEGDSPNPTPKKKAEGSRAKGSMAD